MKETKCILQEAKAAVSSLAVFKSEEKNKIEDYLYDLKVSLKMQMTKGSYSKKDIRKLKKIYDYIAEL